MEAASLVFNANISSASDSGSSEKIFTDRDSDVITEHVANLSICLSRSLPSIDEYFKGKSL